VAQPQFPDEEPEPRLGLGFPPLPDENPIRRDRPPPVVTGCVMAWVGDTVGFVVGVFLLSIPSDSPALDTYAPSNRANVASALHVIGGSLMVWCPIVIIVAVFAFRGARWAALTLVAMAGAYALASIASVVSGSNAQGGLSLIWTLASAGLVYGVPSSRQWFKVKAAERQAIAAERPE
jgi:hypothetical protein